jgi:hypothetical protein
MKIIPAGHRPPLSGEVPARARLEAEATAVAATAVGAATVLATEGAVGDGAEAALKAFPDDTGASFLFAVPSVSRRQLVENMHAITHAT